MMASPRSYAWIWRHASVVPLLVALAWQPAIADQGAGEREQLAAIARQLELVDRLAEHAADVSPQDRARYHFDYARLHEDVKRIRAGIQDYLVPVRAQPRDPLPLAGDYVRSSPDTCGDTKEVSKP